MRHEGLPENNSLHPFNHALNRMVNQSFHGAAWLNRMVLDFLGKAQPD
jgi:hypothetical protein